MSRRPVNDPHPALVAGTIARAARVKNWGVDIAGWDKMTKPERAYLYIRQQVTSDLAAAQYIGRGEA